MLNCPVCNAQYTEEKVDTCSTCGWYLKDESVKTVSLSVVTWGKQLEALKKAEVWARHIWEKNKQLFDESKLQGKQTLEESFLTKTKLEEESEHQLQLQGFEREREQLKTDLEQSNASLKQSNTKCEELQSQLQQLTQERDELLLNFNQSHQKYEEKNKNVSEEKQQEFERKLKEQDSHLKEKIEQLESDLQKYKEQYEQVHSQIEQMSKLCSALCDLLKPLLEPEREKEAQPKISSKGQEHFQQPNQEEQSPTPMDSERLVNQQPQEINALLQKPEVLENNFNNWQEYNSSSNRTIASLPVIIASPNSEENLLPEERKLVNLYNENPKIFSDNYKVEVVSETEESINQRHRVISQPIIEKHRHGNYWILMPSGCKYLVPKENFKINEHSYNAVEALFECLDYQASGSSEFKLVKPAKVSSITGSEKWQLEERGIIQF
ncbi:hypothetical protein QUA81_20085 [Microcoleus sp. F6_B4]